MKEYIIPEIIKPEELEGESPLKQNLRFTKEFFLDFLLSVVKNPISFLIHLLIFLFLFIVFPNLIQNFKNESTAHKVQSFIETKGYEISQVKINAHDEEADVITNKGKLLVKDIYSSNMTMYKKIK